MRDNPRMNSPSFSVIEGRTWNIEDRLSPDQIELCRRVGFTVLRQYFSGKFQPVDKENIVQDMFVKFLQMRQLPEDIKMVASTLTRQTALDHMRARSCKMRDRERTVRLDPSDEEKWFLADGGLEPVDVLSRREQMRRLLDCLHSSFRESSPIPGVVILRLQGYGYREIANLLGLKFNDRSMRRRYAQGLQALLEAPELEPFREP
jgi:DNA-directed RNA polymerase specialized sigma24 family protein